MNMNMSGSMFTPSFTQRPFRFVIYSVPLFFIQSQSCSPFLNASSKAPLNFRRFGPEFAVPLPPSAQTWLCTWAVESDCKGDEPSAPVCTTAEGRKFHVVFTSPAQGCCFGQGLRHLRYPGPFTHRSHTHNATTPWTHLQEN